MKTIKTLIGFSYDIADHGYGLLGQKGLFDKFLVKFNFSEKEIELTPKKNTRLSGSNLKF